MKRILLFTISLSVLIFGFSAPAQAAPKSIKLSKSQVKNVGPYQCGLVKGTWVPGRQVKSTKKNKFFIPYTSYAADETKKANSFTKKAKKVKGKSKSAVKKRAKLNSQATKAKNKANSYSSMVTAQSSSCASGVYGIPTAQAPLRINISGARGLAKSTGSVSSFINQDLRPITSGQSDVSARSMMSGDSLVSVMSNGTLRDSITSGSIQINNFVVAANGKAYISTGGVSIDGNWSNGMCVLLEVSAATDVPTCIQGNSSTPGNNYFSMSWFGSYQNNYNPSIQVDATGAVYYSGYSNNSAVLRKYSNGNYSNIVSDNISIQDFLVLPSGDVLVAGYTNSTSSSWLRLYTVAGGIRSIENTSPSFLRIFPDGNVYYGTIGGEIRIINTNTLSKVPTPWYGNGGTYACVEFSNECHFVGSPRAIVKLTNGSVYALAHQPYQAGLTRIFPDVSTPRTSGTITDPKLIGVAGSKVAIAGTDANGIQSLSLYDPVTDSFTAILGSSNEIEIGAMSFRSSDNQLVFSGLRFADNRTIVGTLNLSDNSVNIGISTSFKLYDLQAFG